MHQLNFTAAAAATKQTNCYRQQGAYGGDALPIGVPGALDPCTDTAPAPKETTNQAVMKREAHAHAHRRRGRWATVGLHEQTERRGKFDEALTTIQKKTRRLNSKRKRQSEGS